VQRVAQNRRASLLPQRPEQRRAKPEPVQPVLQRLLRVSAHPGAAKRQRPRWAPQRASNSQRRTPGRAIAPELQLEARQRAVGRSRALGERQQWPESPDCCSRPPRSAAAADSRACCCCQAEPELQPAVAPLHWPSYPSLSPLCRALRREQAALEQGGS